MSTLDLAPHNPYGLALTSPIIAAAGCLGYAVEYARLIRLEAFGAIVTRSTTLHARRYGRAPRLLETPSGVLSVGGWPNPGIQYVIEHYTTAWAGWKTPVLLSIAGETASDIAEMVRQLEGIEGIAGFEIALDSASDAAQRVAAVRALSQLPLLAKLPPLDDQRLSELAKAVAAAGADALTVAGAPTGQAYDSGSSTRLEGRLSGPALLPQTLQRIATVAAATETPLIASGGISSAEAVQQCLDSGASAVQLGVALLADPWLGERIYATLGYQPSEV